jgi:hypothetical protein
VPVALRGPRLPAPAWAAIAILVAGGVAAVAVSWPGHYSYDSIVQLDQGRSGLYNAWHPPVMAWLLGLADRVTPGGAMFTVLEAALVFGALASLAAMARPGAWAAPMVALAVALTPQAAIYPAIVWKDVLFAGAALSAFACLAWAARAWEGRGWRWALIVKAGVLLALAALARQNGLILIPVAAVTLSWVAARRAPGRGWRDGAVAGGTLLAVAVAATLAGSAALKLHSDGQNERQRQWTELRIYEIVAARRLDPHTDFTVLAAKAPVLNAFLTRQGPTLYNLQRIDPLVQNDTVEGREDRDRPAVLAQWRAIFAGDPWLYLRVRAAMFRWVLMTPDLKACVPLSVGVNGPPDVMAHLKIESRYSDADDLVFNYAQAFFGTPVFSHAAWGVLGALLLIPLLMRRRPEDLAVAGLLAGALSFAASFFAISIACDYRYLYFLDLSALAGALYVAAAFTGRDAAKG